ncbi:MAG: glycosyltransferase [bacterium]|nr:glycosyltransferase [bacterium]
MIPFILPYFDETEAQVLKTQCLPTSLDISVDSLRDSISKKFPNGDFILTESGEQAIRSIVVFIKEEHGFSYPTIAIPSVICGSVYRAVKHLGKVILMDVDKTWNCKPDTESRKADILSFASLSGKRMDVPLRHNPRQIIIDDSAQCYDGISGFREGSDFSIFSFGKGKQMYAGGGGVLYSKKHNLTKLKEHLSIQLPDWQIFLMASQLNKIARINDSRRQHGLRYLEELQGIEWLRVPEPSNHVFSKFVVFIDQGGEQSFDPKRTPEIINFMRYMWYNQIAVEETYIPLHVRFPNELINERYRCFRANRDWIEAITLPCRPNLRPEEIEHIIKSVRNYKPISKKSLRGKSHNREVYETKYSSANLKPRERGDYFGNLYHLRMDLIRQWGQGKRILDVGCGNGALLIPLLEEGYEVVGLDFSKNLLRELQQEWRKRGGKEQNLYLCCADARSIPTQDSAFDFIFSVATLYHIPDIESVMAEFRRVLKDGGVALLEFGNIRSLNTIEASRVSTGVCSYHLRLGWLKKIFHKMRFKILEHRAFQLFPMYGGGTPLTAQLLNPLLRNLLAEQVGNVMLDELISSSPLLSKFAFRHLFILQKSAIPLEHIQNSQNLPGREMSAWSQPDKIRKRSTARELFNRGEVRGSIQILVNLLKQYPTDVLTVLSLAEMYDNKEEQLFVQHNRRLVERATRILETKQVPQMISPNIPVPLVSIVLPTYNQITMLQKAVRSVLEQSFKDFELIIVNDGSTDGTDDYLKTLADSRIRVIHQTNQRLPAALNTGFRAARGELLTWVSSDNYCAPYFLEALVGALATHPEAGLAYADFFLIDENDHLIRRVSVPDYGYRSLLIRNDGNAAFLYRRACMEKIGLYDTELEGAEDWDYWIRMAEHFDFVYVPEALYYYRLHEKSMQNTMRRQVNIAARQTIENALARKGGNINLVELYPSLSTCRDQKGALFTATFDFGTRLLRARVRMEKIFVPFLEKAVELNPAFIPAYINLGVAYGYSKQWEKAQRCVEKLKDVTESNFVPIIKQLTEACQHRSPQALNNVPLFSLNKQSIELFQRECVLRRVYSFTLDSFTTPSHAERGNKSKL